MSFQVLVQNPAGEVLRWELDKSSVYLGRLEGNDIRLTHSFVSGLHLLIERRGSGFVVKDLGSTEGTLLRGKVIEPHVEQSWRFGESLQIGNLVLQVEPGEDETLVEVLPESLTVGVRGELPAVSAASALGSGADVIDAVPNAADGNIFDTAASPPRAPARPLPWGLILQFLAAFVVLAGVMLAVVTLLL